MEGACPRCGADAVEFDLVAGISACEACGAVLSDEQLVHGGGPQALGGTFVGAADTGEHAAARALDASGTGLAIQRSRVGTSESRIKGRTREVCALLRLQPSVVDQSLHLAAQALPHLDGPLRNWRRDYLAAACAYAACRLNSLPITLADLSAALQVDVHTLGSHYQALCRLLGLQPPLLMAGALLPRAVDRVAAEAAAAGALGGATPAALQRDAEALLGWMDQQVERGQHPMAGVGAALVLAAEMNTVSLSLDHVSASLQLHRRTLESKLTWTRQRLVQLAALLPYAATITTRNVGSHARTIINLSALMGRAADSAQAAAQQAAPPPALQAPQQQVERLQGAQQTAQPAAEDAARQKRPRLASAAGPSLATAGSLPADAAVPDPEGRPEEPAERSRPEQAAQSKEAAREQQQAGVT